MPDSPSPWTAHVRINQRVSERLELLRARYPSLETRTALLLFAVDVGLRHILSEPNASVPRQEPVG